MTYFHMRTHTIIGAKLFHCPVRDGKEWGRLAMVVRQTVARELGAGSGYRPEAQRPPGAFGRSKGF